MIYRRAVGRWLLAVAVFCLQPAVFSIQLSAVGFQPSAFMFHPSAFSFSLQLQLSAVLPAPFRRILQLADSACSLQLQQAGETTNLVRLQIELILFLQTFAVPVQAYGP